MPSNILSDNGVSSGSAGLKTTAASDGVLALQTTTAGGTATTAITVDTSQNVGIGATGSTFKVAVDSGSSGQMFNFNSTNASGGYLRFQNSGTSVADIGTAAQIVSGSATDFGMNARSSGSLVFGTGNTERMRITSSGAVFMGTTSGLGSGKLQVYNLGLSINASNANNVNGDIDIVSALGANCNNSTSYHFLAATNGADKCYILGNGNLQNVNNSYGTLSDIKLKENIVDATPKLADIMRLQVRNFNLKSDPDHKQIGFVAQEIEQVFPSIIEEISDLDENRNLKGTTTKGVKTSILVPMLVKAIQELKAINDTQAEELSRQAATINALVTRIEALENK